MGSALHTSHCLEAQVSSLNLTIELYAFDEQDLFLCSDGYALQNTKDKSLDFLTKFVPGIY